MSMLNAFWSRSIRSGYLCILKVVTMKTYESAGTWPPGHRSLPRSWPRRTSKDYRNSVGNYHDNINFNRNVLLVFSLSLLCSEMIKPFLFWKCNKKNSCWISAVLGLLRMYAASGKNEFIFSWHWCFRLSQSLSLVNSIYYPKYRKVKRRGTDVNAQTNFRIKSSLLMLKWLHYKK